MNAGSGNATPHTSSLFQQLLFDGLLNEIFIWVRSDVMNVTCLVSCLVAQDDVRNGPQRGSTYFKLWCTKPQGGRTSPPPHHKCDEGNAVFKDSKILQYLFVYHTGITQLRFCSAKHSYLLYGLYSLRLIAITSIKPKYL